MYIFNKKKVLGRAIQPYLKIYVDWLYSITMYVSCIYKYLCTLIQTTSIVRLMVTKRALFDSPSNNLDWRSLAFFLLSHTPKRLHEWKIHKHSYLLIRYLYMHIWKLIYTTYTYICCNKLLPKCSKIFTHFFLIDLYNHTTGFSS